MTKGRVWAVALGLAVAACHRPPEPAARNVVLILVDTLRRDHLACYGYTRDPAPTITALATAGAILEGVTPSSWTKPATASLLTGLHPIRHRVLRKEDALPREAVTLAEVLKARGYRTLGVSANISVAPDFAFDQGFEEFVVPPEAAFGGVGPRADALNREIVARLSRLAPPFFLYVHYVDPHTPYEPRRAWDGGPLDGRLARVAPLTGKELATWEFRRRPADLVRDARDLYDGDIRGADDGIAELLRQLAARGLMESTLTVVTADHGEEFAEHGRMEHGQSLYEEVLQVPLIVHAPGKIPPGPHRGPVSLLDVTPTILELLGAPVPPGLDGISIAPLLRSGRSEMGRNRLLVAHLELHEMQWLAVRDGNDKLVLARGPYRKEMFDLSEDPRERFNRAHDPGTTKAFRRLAGILARQYNDLAAHALPRAAGRLTPQLLEALAALGYLSHRPRAVFPPRIRPADPSRLGDLGWDRPFAPCVQPGDEAAIPQLLEGWWYVEAGGRWTRPEAEAALAAPGTRSGLSLELEGMNWDRRPARLRISVDGVGVLDDIVPPGRIALRRAVPVAVQDPSLVRLVREPPFVPSDIGLPDRRELGIFVTRLCLRP